MLFFSISKWFLRTLGLFFRSDLSSIWSIRHETSEYVILHSKFCSLAPESVHSLFPSSWSWVLYPFFQCIITDSRALPPVILVSSRAGFPICLPLSLAAETTNCAGMRVSACVRACVRACMRACVRPSGPLFFGTRGERGRRSPTTRISKHVSDHVWSNDHPYRRSIFPPRRSSFDSAVKIDAIHLRWVNRVLSWVMGRIKIEVWRIAFVILNVTLIRYRRSNV